MRVQPGCQLVVSGWLAINRGRKAFAKFQFPRVVSIYDKRWTGRKTKLTRRTTSKKGKTFRLSSHLSCSLLVLGHHNFVQAHLYIWSLSIICLNADSIVFFFFSKDMRFSADWWRHDITRKMPVLALGVPGLLGHEKGRCEPFTFVAVTFSDDCFLIPWQFRFDIRSEVPLVPWNTHYQ